MRTADFYRVSAVRQQARAGCSVADLAARFGYPVPLVEAILATRTIEGATKLLEKMDSTGIVKRFVLIEDRIVDFTALYGA